MHTHFYFFIFLFFYFFSRTKLHTCMHKPVSRELNWPMYSTHAIIIAKQREIKNLPNAGRWSWRQWLALDPSVPPPSSTSPHLSLSWVAYSLPIIVSLHLCLYSSFGPPVLSLMFCSLVSFVCPLVFSVFFRFPSFSSVLVLYCGSPLESSGSGAVVAEDGDLAYSECWTEERKLTAVAVVHSCWKQQLTHRRRIGSCYSHCWRRAVVWRGSRCFGERVEQKEVALVDCWRNYQPQEEVTRRLDEMLLLTWGRADDLVRCTVRGHSLSATMPGNVVVAQRRGQGWRGSSFGLKLERKRKATEGLLWLFLVTGGRRGVRKLGEGQRQLV
jgi:hypothetical protein